MALSVCRRNPARLLVCTLVAALVALGPTPHGAAGQSGPTRSAPPEGAVALHPGVPVERDIGVAPTHVFTIEAHGGDYLSVVVDQRGVDFAAALYAPDGVLLLDIERASGRRDVERVDAIVPSTGTCTLVLRPVHGGLGIGRYETLLVERRPATPEDHKRASTRAFLAETYRALKGKEDKQIQSRAVDRFDQARLTFRASGDFADEAQVVGEMADIIFYNLGEFQRGTDTWNLMVELARKSGDRRLLIHSLLERAWASFNSNNSESYRADYREAFGLSREIRDPYLVSRAIEGMGNAAHGYPLDPPIAYYTEALALRSTVAGDCSCLHLLTNLAIHLTLKRDQARAIEVLNRTLDASRACGSKVNEVFALISLGMEHELAGSPHLALEYFERALAAGVGQLNSGRRDTLVRLAQVERDLGRLDQARAHAAEALAMLERNIASTSSETLEFSVNNFKSLYYGAYVDTLLALHARDPKARYDAEAFVVSEQARARRLLGLLSFAGSAQGKGVDPRLVERERRARDRLDEALEAQIRNLGAGGDPNLEATLASDVTRIKAEYEAIQVEMRDQSSFYASTRTRPLDVESVRNRLLDDDTLLLEYLIGARKTFLFAISRQSLTTYDLGSSGEIYEAALAFRRSLSVDGSADTSAAAARELSRRVLGPVAHELGGKRLAIVADSILNTIPFTALTDPNSTSGEPLVVRHEVTMLPSATAAVFQRERLNGRRPAAKSVAVLADPIFSRNDSRVRSGARGGSAERRANRKRARRSASRAGAGASDYARARAAWETAGLVRRGEEIVRLPFTRLEADRIVKAAPVGTSLSALGFAASERTVESGALGTFRVLHFATHGFLAAAQPELSGLVLSLVDERGEPADGFLSVPDVFNLDLPAELVVLSGCETALGREVSGEGLVGLPRAFMFAGTPRTIASLWAVQDRATAVLMGLMYDGIFRRGLAPAAALREAQVSMLKEVKWSSPRQWAAFVHQGDWRCPKL
jgi:CHAT domain-containing protein